MTGSPGAADYRAAETAPAKVANTDRGPVEYGESGDGPPLVSLHGSPAAYANGLLFGEFARVAGFRVIAPSRPGYGGTPLEVGRTPGEHADAIAALLDALGLDTVAVAAVSGGGPAGYALAGRHPDRVTCLLQVDAIALPLPAPRGATFAMRIPALTAISCWLLERFPRRMLTTMGAPATDDPELLATHQALARGLIITAAGWDRLGVGWTNEAAQVRGLDPLPFDRIICPTLIVHAETDTVVPTEHARHAHARIAGSRLHWIEGGHTAFPFSPAAQADAIDWLRGQQHPGSAA